jgi:hypothetical protein
LDSEGNGAEKNEVHLKVAKSKPKGVSKNGVYKLYLDLDKYQYYMLDFKGNRIYANREKKQAPQLKMTNLGHKLKSMQ